MSVTHYNNELGEVVEYEMLDPQCLAEMRPLGGRVYVRVRVSVRVIFSITWPRLDTVPGPLCLTGCSVVTIAMAKR